MNNLSQVKKLYNGPLLNENDKIFDLKFIYAVGNCIDTIKFLLENNDNLDSIFDDADVGNNDLVNYKDKLIKLNRPVK